MQKVVEEVKMGNFYLVKPTKLKKELKIKEKIQVTIARNNKNNQKENGIGIMNLIC